MKALVIAGAFLALAALPGCGEMARQQVSDGIGPDPKLPPPNKTLIPTVNIAKVIGWAEDQAPQPAPGLKVAAFARDLDHPRWLHVLPNGDVLVAETNKPAKPEDAPGGGIRGWIMDKMMAKAGAGVAKRRPDHAAARCRRRRRGRDSRRHSSRDCIRRSAWRWSTTTSMSPTPTQSCDFLTREGATRIEAAGTRVAELPAGPRNHHWTKSLIASPDGDRLYATVGSNSNVAEFGMQEEEGRAAIWEIDLASGKHRIFATGLRNPNGMAWVGMTCSGRSSTSATRSAATSCRTT